MPSSSDTPNAFAQIKRSGLFHGLAASSFYAIGALYQGKTTSPFLIHAAMGGILSGQMAAVLLTLLAPQSENEKYLSSSFIGKMLHHILHGSVHLMILLMAMDLGYFVNRYADHSRCAESRHDYLTGAELTLIPLALSFFLISSPSILAKIREFYLLTSQEQAHRFKVLLAELIHEIQIYPFAKFLRKKPAEPHKPDPASSVSASENQSALDEQIINETSSPKLKSNAGFLKKTKSLSQFFKTPEHADKSTLDPIQTSAASLKKSQSHDSFFSTPQDDGAFFQLPFEDEIDLEKLREILSLNYFEEESNAESNTHQDEDKNEEDEESYEIARNLLL